MKEAIIGALAKAVSPFGIPADSIKLEYPENPDHGDFSSNVAMVNAKALKMSPKALAEKIAAEFQKAMQSGAADIVESVSIAGPGFINFKVKDEAFVRAISELAAQIAQSKDDGASGSTHFNQLKWPYPKAAFSREVMVEYTDPNICKVFHIGHLMSNAIGESLSRLIEGSGAKTIRACYPSDVGLNVAKTVAAIGDWDPKNMPGDLVPLKEKAEYLGRMYVKGTELYDSDEAFKARVIDINKKIFAKDESVNKLYHWCRFWSLEYFKDIYKRLDTEFNVTFFESDVAAPGVVIVKEFLTKGVFAVSEGAVVFKGEDHGLHTRVFITSQGLPTYETKELGLNVKKFETYPRLNESIIVTANEQNDYFKVLLKAFELIDPNVAKKTRHLSHGLLRFASGKMSSRKGNIVSAESLIDEVKGMAKEKMSNAEFSFEEIDEISDQVAIAAIKYTILRQAIGGDVVFDSVKSISFEGDSGPYLQYSAVRAQSVLNKANWTEKYMPRITSEFTHNVGLLEKLIVRFPDIVERARDEYAPQLVANYLISLAGAFNSYYALNQIVDTKDPQSPYRVALTQAFLTTMTNGLWVLGIKVPKKM